MTAEALHAPAEDGGEKSYLTEGWTLTSWIFSTDHKRIGILYAVSITVFFFIGGAAATLMRIQLFEPHNTFVSASTYNRLFTMHGVIMVWFFLVPSIPATLGNFLIPLMVGAKDVALPKLNLLSWWLYVIGALFTVACLISGGADTGWTFYTPYSTLYSNASVLAAAAGVFVVGFSSILTGVNMITTVHMLRAPGLTWFRLPLFVWGIYAVSLVMVLATPV
ncbi:MAG: cbb3-type cytochrome c oxidase subunit I, partial [Caulobacteraceae bacterium]